jgi:hypothetical protein
MYIITWLTSIAIALAATCTIAFALPMSADDELSRATVSPAILDTDASAMHRVHVPSKAAESERLDAALASCMPDAACVYRQLCAGR